MFGNLPKLLWTSPSFQPSFCHLWFQFSEFNSNPEGLGEGGGDARYWSARDKPVDRTPSLPWGLGSVCLAVPGQALSIFRCKGAVTRQLTLQFSRLLSLASWSFTEERRLPQLNKESGDHQLEEGKRSRL